MTNYEKLKREGESIDEVVRRLIREELETAGRCEGSVKMWLTKRRSRTKLRIFGTNVSVQPAVKNFIALRSGHTGSKVTIVIAGFVSILVRRHTNRKSKLVDIQA